ncbi:hypothetical protein D3G64_26985 [Escherichia coli]|nr:hypothetical protein [Escherichia coli]
MKLKHAVIFGSIIYITSDLAYSSVDYVFSRSERRVTYDYYISSNVFDRTEALTSRDSNIGTYVLGVPGDIPIITSVGATYNLELPDGCYNASADMYRSFTLHNSAGWGDVWPERGQESHVTKTYSMNYYTEQMDHRVTLPSKIVCESASLGEEITVLHASTITSTASNFSKVRTLNQVITATYNTKTQLSVALHPSVLNYSGPIGRDFEAVVQVDISYKGGSSLRLTSMPQNDVSFQVGDGTWEDYVDLTIDCGGSTEGMKNIPVKIKVPGDFVDNTTISVPFTVTMN